MRIARHNLEDRQTLRDLTRTLSISILHPTPNAALNRVLGFMILIGLFLIGYGLILLGEDSSSLSNFFY